MLYLKSFLIPNVRVLEDFTNITPKSTFVGEAKIFYNYSPVSSINLKK